MASPKHIPSIYVLAGTNGGGKSSIAGAMFRESGAEYFNPDEAAREILSRTAGLSPADANSLAWYEGKRLLERAIDEKLNYAFETTLGGHTISTLLRRAIAVGIEVRIWYVGLASVEQHIARVKSRVKEGGHDIREERIRERFDTSRLNLISLMPELAELRVFDNSLEANPARGEMPQPRLLLHMIRGEVQECGDLDSMPEWVKPIIAAAMR